MNSRVCKIAVVSAKALAVKPVSAVLAQSGAVSTFEYQAGQPFSPEQLQEITDCNLVYFLYDAEPTALASRQDMVPFLLQIKTEKEQSGKDPYCVLVGKVSDYPADQARLDILSRVKQNGPRVGFNAAAKPVCTTHSGSVSDFKKMVATQVAAMTAPADRYGVDASAQPSVSPVLPVAASHDAQPQPAPASIAPIVIQGPVDPLIAQAKQLLDNAIQQAEDKLRLQKAELENLRALKERAAQVVQAHQKRDTDPGAFLLALQNFSQHSGKIRDGRRDVKRMLIGAIECLIGVALLSLSIPFFFIAPPLALAQAATAVNLIIAAVVGVGFFAHGAYTMYHARKHGVTQEGQDFVESANKQPALAS